MKILYGVQATGNGHITRARALARHFNTHKIQVDYLFSGRAKKDFFDMEIFGDWRCFRGLTFVHESGKLNIPKTLARNSLKQLLQDIKSLDLSSYDLILTDFEPITAWAAKQQKKNCIGVGHQYAFGHKVPTRGDNIISRSIMRYFAPAKVALGLHWHHFGNAILPPIAEVHEHTNAVDHNKIVVYLGFESHDDIVQLLEPFKKQLFVVYGPYANYESFENIQFKPLSRQGFQNDLATAGGVICNAGFELASEAIQLGKKLLVKPLSGQMEQLSNARALEDLQLGMSMDSLNSEVVKQWLGNFKARQIVYPDVAGAIVEWLQEPKHHAPAQASLHIRQLAEQLWLQTKTTDPKIFTPLTPNPPRAQNSFEFS